MVSSVGRFFLSKHAKPKDDFVMRLFRAYFVSFRKIISGIFQKFVARFCGLELKPLACHLNRFFIWCLSHPSLLYWGSLPLLNVLQ